MLEMEMINAPGAGAGLVPVPILGRAVLFVGTDGVMRARLPDGSFVQAVGGGVGMPGADGRDGVDGLPGAPGADGADGLPGAQGAPGADGADGLPGAQGAPGSDGADGVPGQIVSLHTATLGQARPGLAGGLLLHEFPLTVPLLGRVIRARGLLSVSSAGAVNVSAQISAGGLLVDFPAFSSNGARLIRFEVDIHVQAAAAADGGVMQGNAALTGAAGLTFSRRSALAGAVSSNVVGFSIKGTLAAVTVLAASIEVL